MIDLDRAIASARLLLTAAEGLTTAIHAARQALEDGTAKLKEALGEAEQLRDRLASDRAEADTALDKKFKDEP